jgi:hypothetical protein
MRDDPDVWSRTVLQSVEGRVPKIILHGAEELYCAVVESMVSGLLAENSVMILFSVHLCTYRNLILW